MFARLNSLLRALARRPRFERDLDAEISFHLDRRAEDLARGGLPPDEARRRARLEFGGIERAKQECRDAKGLAWADAARRNAGYALRLLRRSPGFTAAAVLTLGLCVGANTAVFSLVDAVLLRPLPYPEPGRLVQVGAAFKGRGAEGVQLSQTGRTWEAVRDRLSTVDAAALSGLSAEVNVIAGGHVESVRLQRVSAGFFRVLGVPALLGRGFTQEEDRPGGAPVVVIAHAAWQRLLAADPSVLGRTIRLRGEIHTVVGIMPASFTTTSGAEVWTPLRPTTTGEGGGSNYQIIGRLKPGVGMAQAETEAAAIGRHVFREADVPRDVDVRLHLLPLQAGLTADLRRPLFLVWGAVGLVLLIGCANIAGLLLARSAERNQEIATRVALGGGRGAVLAQLLTENLILALLGCAAGLAIGWLALAVLERRVAQAFGIWQEVSLDGRVLLVTIAVSGLTSIVFGLWPALRATRLDVRGTLLDAGSRTIAGASRHWPARLLVVAQVALGLTLLVGAGLLVRTFLSLNSLPAGFDPHQLVTAQVSVQDPRYASAERLSRLFDESLARIRALPGVEAAAVTLSLPYERALNLGFTRPGAEPRITSLTYVTPGFFEAVRMPILRGRSFREADAASSGAVVIANRAFARLYFQSEDFVGERLATAGSDREVVGIVGDVPQPRAWGDFGPLAPVPTLYVPAAQMPDSGLAVIHTWFAPRWVVRTTAPASGLLPAMQSALASVDPLLPFTGFRTMDDVRAESIANQRVRALLVGALAALALVLTVVGIYGLVAQGVTQRSHELGIRLALGASPRQALASAAAPGVSLALAGTLLGLGLSALLVPLLRSLIWGVQPLDRTTFALAAAGVLASAVVASVLPALRAARLDPVRTLRSE